MDKYLNQEGVQIFWNKAIEAFATKIKPNDITNPVYFRFANGGSAISIQSSSPEKERSITFSDMDNGGNNFSIGCFGESSKAGDAYYPCIWHNNYGVQYIATEKWVKDNYGATRSTSISTAELKNILGDVDN